MAKKAPARKAASGARGRKPVAAGRKKAAAKKTQKTKTTAGSRKAGGARKAARKGSAKSAGARKVAAKKPAGKRAAPRKATGSARKTAAKRSARPPRGGTGAEATLAQTPATGRTVKGPTNPMKTKRSTGTPAGAGTSRNASLERARRNLREVEENVPTPPSSLDLDRTASAARSGRRELEQARREHTEAGPDLTAGDVDASWEDAYSVGDEAPGGDNPTPDQDRVDDIGKALGVEYEDNEELKGADKISERDRHRWELDPASSDDYLDRD
jgi:hypothetical protein